jgi:hypothetical protein
MYKVFREPTPWPASLIERGPDASLRQRLTLAPRPHPRTNPRNRHLQNQIAQLRRQLRANRLLTVRWPMLSTHGCDGSETNVFFRFPPESSLITDLAAHTMSHRFFPLANVVALTITVAQRNWKGQRGYHCGAGCTDCGACSKTVLYHGDSVTTPVFFPLLKTVDSRAGQAFAITSEDR